MCTGSTLGDIQRIEKEVTRWKMRHKTPYTVLESLYKYHDLASHDKVGEAIKTKVPVEHTTIYELHREYAEMFFEAMEMLRLGGLDD
jgi:hypothetical protein